MSESRGDSQPADGGEPQSSGSESKDQSRASQPRANGQSRGATQGRGPARAGDPVADFQRWLMKAGARSMATQVADQVKRTLGAERRASGDVWDTATNELPPDEPPECQWCPVCQAARAARLGSAGGLGAALTGAGGILASAVQDAFAAFEQVMKTQDQNRSAERSGGNRPPHGGTGGPAPRTKPGASEGGPSGSVPPGEADRPAGPTQ